MEEAVLNPCALLTATEAATLAEVTVAAICNWRARGYLPVATDANGREIRDRHRRPKYRFIDVVKAEQATKARGEKMAAGMRRPTFQAAA